MEILSEESLSHVFGFLKTIHDWVTISQVCTKWEKVMIRYWKKMDVFAIDTKIFPKAFQSITIEELILIIELAGPYIKFASLELEDMYITRIHLGPHLINLDEFIETRDLIEILSEHSGNICSLELINCTQKEKNNRLLRSLFKSNSNLEKLRLKDCSLETIFDDMVLPSVTEMKLRLKLDLQKKSLSFIKLHERLPNLIKFEAVLDVFSTSHSHLNVSQINWFFCQILPDNSKLQILKLYFRQNGYYINRRSLLTYGNSGELKSIIDKIDADIFDNIVKLIVSKCVNVHSILLSKLVLSSSNIEHLMSLPKLEALTMNGMTIEKKLSTNWSQTV